jgi:hypothetical protein
VPALFQLIPSQEPIRLILSERLHQFPVQDGHERIVGHEIFDRVINQTQLGEVGGVEQRLVRCQLLGLLPI